MSPCGSPRGCLSYTCPLQSFCSTPPRLPLQLQSLCVGQGAHKALRESLLLLQPCLRTARALTLGGPKTSSPPGAHTTGFWAERSMVSSSPSTTPCHLNTVAAPLGPTVSQRWGWSHTHTPAGLGREHKWVKNGAATTNLGQLLISGMLASSFCISEFSCCCCFKEKV